MATVEGKQLTGETTMILNTKKLPNGHIVRLQKRGSSFDVIRNTTGIASAWHYVEKAVSEDRARNTFDLLVIGG